MAEDQDEKDQKNSGSSTGFNAYADTSGFRFSASYGTGCGENNQNNSEEIRRQILRLRNGKKLRNTWRTIQSGKKKYTYYFGSNGAAYQASKEMMGRYGVIVKKIRGQYYGFDYLGHRVKGVRVGSTSTYGMPYVFYFNSMVLTTRKEQHS